MAIIPNGHQGRRRGQHNPNQFTRQDISDTRPRRDASPVAVSSGTNPRTRLSVAASGIEQAVPEQKDYFVPWAPGFHMSKDEYDSAMKKDRLRQEQKLAAENRRAEQARTAEAHRVDAERDAELLKHAATIKTMLQIQLSKQLESDLVIGEIESTMSAHGATLEETQAVGASLAKEGCTELPSMWESRLLELRRKS